MGNAIISAYNNDRFYKAVGAVTINATFLKGAWEYVYFNTLAMVYDDAVYNWSFNDLIRNVRREIYSKNFVNSEAKKNLLELTDKTAELNTKRNAKIHATIFNAGDHFLLMEKKNKIRTMEKLDDDKIKEIEDIADEIAKLGRVIHEIPYERDYYKLVEETPAILY